jgi:predicted transport protein
MSDIRLFRVDGKGVSEIVGSAVSLEKSLQTLIEKNLEVFLGVRFLASEYVTRKTHGGRIDTLGIDENSCPVIIEYKRSLNENVINQGLFYLDWLLDHKADFQLLVQKVLGPEVAAKIVWTAPRLLCIAGDFTRYDEHAVAQIDRNIELIRYRRYGNELILLDLVNATTAQPIVEPQPGGGEKSYKTITAQIADADAALTDLFEATKAFLKSLGDDVQMTILSLYVAFKRIKNFACVEVRTNLGHLLIYVKVDPEKMTLEDGFTRDVSKIGHYGTGDLEITLKSLADLERAKPLLVQSYEAS